MKICPKCRGLYFDQDITCIQCHIVLFDKLLFKEIEQELYEMGEKKRIEHRFDKRYEIICKYQYPYEYNYEQEQQKTEDYYNKLQQKTRQKTNNQLNKPKCLICQSTNLSKITVAQKAGKITLFGIFGMGDNGKTWKCNNCGSKF